MLSRERAEWMVNDLEKRLLRLQELKMDVDTNKDDIDRIKASLSYYRSELVKMEQNNLSSIEEVVELPTLEQQIFQEKKVAYNENSSWTLFTQKIKNKRINPQRINGNKVRGI